MKNYQKKIYLFKMNNTNKIQEILNNAGFLISNLIDKTVIVKYYYAESVLGTDKTLTANDVIEIVCKTMYISDNKIRGNSRLRHYTNARHIAIYIIWTKKLCLTQGHIGKLFGGRDHSSIIHAIQRVENGIKDNYDKMLRDQYELCERAILEHFEKLNKISTELNITEEPHRFAEVLH